MYSFVENTPVFLIVEYLISIYILCYHYINSIMRANLETPIIVTYLGGFYYKFNSPYTDCSTNKLIFLGEL
jgi:hypothetical protein